MFKVSVALLFVAAQFCFASSAHSQCAYPNKIDWPAGNPVWSMCWVAPNNSSGISGSGLELRHVFYKGKRVF
jgi:hypothetical protein